MALCTMDCFSTFIIFENCFCINRCNLIACPKKRFFGNAIFFISSVSIIAVCVNYILAENVSIGIRMFQTFLAVEFVDLVIAARVRRSSFEAFKRLDEKCGIEDDYIAKLEETMIKYTIFIFASAIFDVIGLKVLKFSANEIIIYSIFFSAQDAELIFFSMLVEAINLRLSKLKDASPVFGSKIYRHVLITTALLNEEFTPKILILLIVILGTTVTYSSVIMLSLTDTDPPLLSYLLWREMKVFFCLWRVCYASYRCEKICQQLVFHLAKILALDPTIDKGKSPQVYSTIHRWYSTILRERPRFASSVLSIGLSVPLTLLDVSVNYVLIIVQIYVAYK